MIPCTGKQHDHVKHRRQLSQSFYARFCYNRYGSGCTNLSCAEKILAAIAPPRTIEQAKAAATRRTWTRRPIKHFQKQLQQQQRQPQAGQETQHKTIPANKFAPTLLSSQRRLFATLGMTSYNEIL